jgi:hypothetical protein
LWKIFSDFELIEILWILRNGIWNFSKVKEFQQIFSFFKIFIITIVVFFQIRHIHYVKFEKNYQIKFLLFNINFNFRLLFIQIKIIKFFFYSCYNKLLHDDSFSYNSKVMMLCAKKIKNVFLKNFIFYMFFYIFFIFFWIILLSLFFINIIFVFFLIFFFYYFL